MVANHYIFILFLRIGAAIQMKDISQIYTIIGLEKKHSGTIMLHILGDLIPHFGHNR